MASGIMGKNNRRGGKHIITLTRTREEVAALPNGKRFFDDTNADALVEAVILFPIMIVIIAALVVLAVFLPTRAALQRATQYAATAIATENSDAWLYFDCDNMCYRWELNKAGLPNVYAALFRIDGDALSRGEEIVVWAESNYLSSKAGKLTVECWIINKFVYKEVVVTASRVFSMSDDFGFSISFIGFPDTIPIVVTSTAVVHNSEEFVRNLDLAVDFVEYISEKFGLTGIGESISSFGGRIAGFLDLD